MRYSVVAKCNIKIKPYVESMFTRPDGNKLQRLNNKPFSTVKDSHDDLIMQQAFKSHIISLWELKHVFDNLVKNVNITARKVVFHITCDDYRFYSTKTDFIDVTHITPVTQDRTLTFLEVADDHSVSISDLYNAYLTNTFDVFPMSKVSLVRKLLEEFPNAEKTRIKDSKRSRGCRGIRLKTPLPTHN